MTRRLRRLAVPAVACAALALVASCSAEPEPPSQPTFRAPEDAVKALGAAIEKGDLDDVFAIFGVDGQELIDSSDPVTARHNRQVFATAVAEGWRLVDEGDHKTLVIGNEEWPFPVPLVQEPGGWRFDTAAGKEEVLARRIGRNELAAIEICHTYVTAQRLYAKAATRRETCRLVCEDRAQRSRPAERPVLAGRARAGAQSAGRPAGTGGGGRRGAAADRQQPSPFHGYYFKILTAQGAAAPGGAKDYVVDGEMSGGFALVAWPARYDATGIMTFLVNQDGVVRQKDLGPGTDAAARGITHYDPDTSWAAID